MAAGKGPWDWRFAEAAEWDFTDTWRFSEDLDFTVDGTVTGAESGLREALETASRRFGIEFSIDEFYEGSDDGYPTYYVEASIQYRAMFDHKNTTELNIMGDEVVAAPPVEHTHEYQDVTPFSLQAYSLAEIFAEKVRTIYQRSRGRDYYDLYQIVIGDETPPPGTVAAISTTNDCTHRTNPITLRRTQARDSRLRPGRASPMTGKRRYPNSWRTPRHWRRSGSDSTRISSKRSPQRSTSETGADPRPRNSTWQSLRTLDDLALPCFRSSSSGCRFSFQSRVPSTMLDQVGGGEPRTCHGVPLVAAPWSITSTKIAGVSFGVSPVSHGRRRRFRPN